MHFVAMEHMLLHSDWQVCVFYSPRSCFFLKVNILLHELCTNLCFMEGRVRRFLAIGWHIGARAAGCKMVCLHHLEF
jgi:hypothetical protein